MLWIEKYRPRSFKEVTTHRDIVEALSSFTLDTIPNIIAYGHSGHNKRTIIGCLINHLYGEYPNLVHRSISIPNGNATIEITYKESNEAIFISPGEYGYKDRIIIQSLIKDMAKSAPVMGLFGENRRKVRIMVIERAESMSRDAQAALRRTMEVYSSHFRILMICDEISKIIEPIRSRSILIRFPAFCPEDQEQICKRILHLEGHAEDPGVIRDIAAASNGNIKRTISVLEIFVVNRESGLNKKIRTEISNFKLKWERIVGEIARQIVHSPTVSGVIESRKRLYELITECIEPQLILQELVALLSKEPYSKFSKVGRIAPVYSERLGKGNKPILHLEAFIAKAMEIFSTRT